MSQLRQNIATKEWVIIATERAKRPEDFLKKDKSKIVLPEYSKDCPFCPGNEHMSPVEHYAIRDNAPTVNAAAEKGAGKNKGNSNTGAIFDVSHANIPVKLHWRVRVIPNKFPALMPEGKKELYHRGIVRNITGIGVHEVIIDTPKHNTNPALYDDTHMLDIINTYKHRYISALSDDRIEAVIIFKNHGDAAGRSLVHPHSQVVATPVVPTHIRDRIAEAMRYYDDHMECVFCRMIKEEIESGERIVMESEHFVVFVPYAAISPFHLWMFPKRHIACFPMINEQETADLARTLKNILARIYYGLNDADYNYVIRSLPGQCRENSFFHWYLSIIPRVTKTAGFELGSGMYINVALPEESAKFLREVKLPPGA